MIAKVRVGNPSEKTERQSLIIPIAVPEIGDIRQLAMVLHERGKPYNDRVWGWPVSYSPSDPTPPPDSHMPFTPADFFIGVWPIWHVSIMWENGDDQEPNISIEDDELIKEE